MADLLDRLSDNLSEEESDQHISAHPFYSAMVAVADGVFTRTQLENHFNIGTTGADKTQLDFIVNGYINAVDKGRYLNACHAVFMLIESGVNLNKTQIQDWLTAAQASY